MTITDICNNLLEYLNKIFKNYTVEVKYDDNFIINIKPVKLIYFTPNVSKEIIVCFSFDTKIIFKLGAYDTQQLDKLIEIYNCNKTEIENDICYSALEEAQKVINYLNELNKPLSYCENTFSFKKDDKDKLQYDLLPSKALAKVVKVLTLGANKYGKDNWKLCNDKSRYINAIFRHLEAYRNGEMLDNESNINHFAHIACNALFMLYFDSKGQK